MEIQYAGENLLPGKLGQFFVILSIGTSLLALISYYFATVNKDKLDLSWTKLGRLAFRLNLFAVIGIGASLFYIIYNHMFEYHYAWAHSSKILPVYYIISCFWEGQEGSFMLWSFWHCVLGWVLIWRAKAWEAGVMTVISFAQFAIATMLLGVYIFGVKIGSSPFVLLRNEFDWPILSRPDYLNLIKDGGA